MPEDTTPAADAVPEDADAGEGAAEAAPATDGAAVERAVAAFRAGEPVLVHDAADREGEVDLLYPAAAVGSDDVARLRNDAGGLICVALAAEVCDAWELPFLADAVEHPAVGGEPGYDDRASFSLTVNHRNTYTGVTDDDRALTIGALAELAGDERAAGSELASGGDSVVAADADPVGAFADRFRVPGHVHLLRSHREGLVGRQGHTELALALADAADRAPAAVVCEMLDDGTGGALPVAAARAYAESHGLAFVEGRAVVDALG